MVKLWQNIDTIKFHLYPIITLDGTTINDYNTILSNILSMKVKSQSAKNNNQSFEEFQLNFKGDIFQVIPSTVRGFSCSIQNSDITLHLKKIVRSCDPNPFCKVEFRSSFLHRYGYLKAIEKVNNFIKSSIISQYTIKISELHLQVDIQGYKFSQLDFHRIKARTRNNRLYDDGHTDGVYYSGRQFQGLMMGGGDNLMRIYNKTKEIKKFPNKSFIEKLWATNKDYDCEKEVFRIEFQLRRAKLKTMVIDGQIMDGFEVILNNLNNIWEKCLSDFSLRNLSDTHCLECLLGYKTLKDGTTLPITNDSFRQRMLRSEVHELWNVISTFNGHYATATVETFVKPFTTDFRYVHNSIKATFSTMLSHYGTLRPEMIIDAFNKVEEMTLEKHNKTLLEDVLSKKLHRFNTLTVNDSTYEKIMNDKEYFMNAVNTVFEDTYEKIYDKGVSQDFYNTFVKKMVS